MESVINCTLTFSTDSKKKKKTWLIIVKVLKAGQMLKFEQTHTLR